MKFSTPHLHLKSINENGEISGYASVFGIVDGHGDIVTAGAFKNVIANFHAGKKPKLLWQHDINYPIGLIEEIFEDNHGLFIKGRLLLEITKAKEVYLLLKNGVIDGFSIGYRIKNNFFKDGKQYLTDIELPEVSIVTFPACEEATVDEVKSINNTLGKIRAISQKITRKINE